MNVILLNKVRNLGDLGDHVNVKPGYGRNYLVPQGQAVPATSKNIKHFESRKAEIEQQAQAALASAQVRAEKLDGLSLAIIARASQEGKLYGSITATDIMHAIQAQGREISKQEIELPEAHIRHVGTYPIKLKLHNGNIVATANVIITAEE